VRDPCWLGKCLCLWPTVFSECWCCHHGVVSLLSSHSGADVLWEPWQLKDAGLIHFQCFNLLKPTGYVTWCTTSLTLNSCTFCPHCIYVFCIYLRTNSDLCHLQHKLIGFYNRDEKCLQRGTDWVFKCSSLRFVFKGILVGFSNSANAEKKTRVNTVCGAVCKLAEY
jgi:hypothetical protein